MPVVINEFEVVADAPPSQRRNGSEPTAEPAAHPVIEPHAIAPALRAIEARALRVWAH
jgi:hypothetical protein